MESQPKIATRPPSGIPRPVSRLPLPTTTASKSIRPSPSRDRLQADPGLDHSRLRRPSYESLLKSPSSRYSSPSKTREQLSPVPSEPVSGLDGSDKLEDASVVGDEEAQEARGRVRQIGPSLSDRTIDTISAIPPSPASAKRQSSFFNGASPIRSPSKTPSNVSNYSRSPSRSSSGQTEGNEFLSQPVSKLRLPSRNRLSVASSTPLSPNKVSDAAESLSRMKMPSSRHSIALGSGTTEPRTPLKKASQDTLNHKSIGRPSFARPSPGKTAPKSVKTEMGPPERPLNVRKTRKPQIESPSTMRSPSTASRYVSAASNIADELTPEQQEEHESRKATKSSSALRDTIAKAKAARKAAAKNDTTDEKPAPQVKPADSWGTIDEDPFDQLPKGSNPGVIRKRVEGARTSGTLNIAALSLTEIPKEVIDMYEFDPDATNWFENVDLVKFIAADNELAEISDATFPDVDPENIDPERDERAPQFGGLETLDLHGNVLRSLPMGIRQLRQLRSLNLSNNSFDMENIQVVIEIPTLVDLKLANNKLEGSLTGDISRLQQLEALDLRGNALTSLPKELAHLTNLKLLDVGENNLASLPFAALSKVPLRTLNAPKNTLQGTLIPESVDRLENLQILNVAGNSIEVFAANDNLALPELQSLFIGINRIKYLPRVSAWQNLTVLSAEDNSIAELPDGLVGLKSLKNVDLTGNNITRLDEKIGLLEGLTSFRIANNPLRERKLLSMSSDEILQDMRNRCEPDPLDTDDEGSVATQFTLAPETPALESGWQVRAGGLLDRSYSEMTELETWKLEMIDTQEVRRLELQHNELSRFPASALEMLAENLTELDLSHNPLESAELLSSPLELPKLQTLNLSAAGLTSIESLLANLKAPALNVLDVSNNRLTGPLPRIRETFPELKSFLVSDNRIVSLEFEAVQGLQVLDVSNNDIESLPPKIGLLAAERSPRNWGSGSALRRFEVAGNRFRVPRWQIVAKGTDAVLQFLKEHIPVQDMPEWEEDGVNADEF
ncbi:Leucine-rich repeat typical subtype [Penicillium cosmopolitanum]|uniref:Leucine-rich repeat typical subtype n=1 Tax=Penicillium cosmopolitanum TaxID=1131564 RepID=A0A9X0BBQ0_9EURO|nr:Leucine-rich repeat typical subtype [Penicillium cosmopolitanum]KAJ5403916.1 Leucine-rich repeat typical subtype [Penicillium cosmopolitanum]